jgi:glyoxylase I family protein
MTLRIGGSRSRLGLGGFSPLLQVFDMPTSIAFYRDVLGFTVASDVLADAQCDFAMLSIHNTTLMLNTAYEADSRPSEPDQFRVAAHGDTSLFFDCANVDAAFEYLRGLGLSVAESVVQDYGMKQLYLKDPDGYEICLQHPA